MSEPENRPAAQLYNPVREAQQHAGALVLTIESQQRRIETAEAEVARLRKGIQNFLDGNYDHPRAQRHEPAMGCKHGRNYYETCDECDAIHFSTLLGEEYKSRPA